MSSPASTNLLDADHPLVEQLRTILKGPALANPRGLFLELNPHLKDDDSFLSRYDARKEAAVLVPIILREEPTVLLTVRSPDMPSHPGQISFPGGRSHPDDPDHAFTALRETEEEVGIPRERVTLIGDLGEHVGGMGYKVMPYVGLIDADAPMVACPREVDEIFEVPLAFLVDVNNHTTTEKRHKDISYRMFFVPYGGYEIWGLTAGILRSLAERFNETQLADGEE